jgi:cyanophycinase-like exopeptidase
MGDKPGDKNLSSTGVLPNPYSERVTLVRDFLKAPHLENLLTDSHFAKRDRMGRTLGFLARIMKDGWSQSPREVAIDEKSAVLVEADGKARVVGTGKGAYFLRPTQAPAVCEKGVPLTFRNVTVYRVPAGGHFDLTAWTGTRFRWSGGRLRARRWEREFIENRHGSAGMEQLLSGICFLGVHARSI